MYIFIIILKDILQILRKLFLIQDLEKMTTLKPLVH